MRHRGFPPASCGGTRGLSPRGTIEVPDYNQDWRVEDPLRAVLSKCSSLLAVVNVENSTKVVQFAHFSVKEFLMSTRLAESSDSDCRYHISLTAAHTFVG
jgi:hypothetical protein